MSNDAGRHASEISSDVSANDSTDTGGACTARVPVGFSSEPTDGIRLPDLGGAIDIMVAETGGALAGVGLTHAHFVLLLAVSEFEPVGAEMLGRVMAVGEQRRSEELQALIAKGAIVVNDDPDTGESVATTAHGRNLLQRAIPLWETAQQRIQDRLGMDRTGKRTTRVNGKRPTVG